MKSVEFRQNLVTLLFGVIGFAVAKSWPDRVNHPEVKALKRLLFPIFFGAASLAMMLYEQRRLVQSISRQSFGEFSTHWTNCGEPVLDVLITLEALTLLLGLWK
jgi:hypothetical protein